MQMVWRMTIHSKGRGFMPESKEAKGQLMRLHRYTADDCLNPDETEILAPGSKKIADEDLVTVQLTDQYVEQSRERLEKGAKD